MSSSRRIIRTCTIVAAATALLLLSTRDAGAAPNFERDVRPVLEKYCYTCHNPKKLKGDLDLTRVKSNAQAKGAAKLFNKLYLPIREREMPPEGAKQIPEELRQTFQHWIDQLRKMEDTDCTKLATDDSKNFYRGFVMSRRINRVEYDFTVRDLFGLPHELGVGQRLFPKDGSGGLGFDNVGDALFTSPVLMEKYLQAADEVLATALPDGGEPAGLASRFTREQLRDARRRVFVEWPGYGVSARSAARQILETFAYRAFRRPVTKQEIDKLLTLFDKADARGDSFEASVKLALKGVLISPHFLFLVEPEPKKTGVYALSDYPLAARLSYFLWGSMPDDELLDLAAQKKLADKTMLARQVKRMLADPRSRGLAETFGLQWLGIRGLGEEHRPDAKKYPEFDDELAAAMKREAVTFIDHVIRENRSLMELVDADYTFLNERLAKHYGVGGGTVKGDAMRRVTVKGGQRGGVLGFGAVHAVTSYPLRTSPVLRGKWVFEDVLGRRVDPPPPDVADLPEGEKVKGLTLRQKLELHRRKPECAACHNKMDPLGFGLENYDVLGRWRDSQDGAPIDASGTLPGNVKFEGVTGLKKLLVTKRRDLFVRAFVRKMISFGFGRGLTEFDKCVERDAIKALKADEYRVQNVVEQIVLSYAFRHRYAKK